MDHHAGSRACGADEHADGVERDERARIAAEEPNQDDREESEDDSPIRER